MDPYEAEEFFKLSEPQRSSLLYVRLKNLEQEVSDLRMILNMEARNVRPPRSSSPGATGIMGRPADQDMGYQSMASILRPRGRTQPTTPRRAVAPFSLAGNTLENDLRESANGRPTANDRPLYLQKLIQVDNLCKEEMARMTAARQNLEPLNQLACDWKLEEVEDDGNGGDLEGLSDARMVRHRDRNATDDFLASLATTSKALSTLELAKMGREAFGGRKMKDFK
uniref:Proton-associated sugar transporter A n=1 Tax=Lygus hesperus TaxID=30085 RepID=A0A0A9W133_LYGHE